MEGLYRGISYAHIYIIHLCIYIYRCICVCWVYIGFLRSYMGISREVLGYAGV